MKKIAIVLMLSVIGCSSNTEVADNSVSTDGGKTPYDSDVLPPDATYVPDSSEPSKPIGYCESGTDCESKVCLSNLCQEPASNDAVQNGDETDVDCGGMHAPKCATNLKCSVNADCQSDACRYDHVCIPGSDRSCTGHFGGDTCGKGEVDSPNAEHESCCTKLTIPSGVQVDKYKVTAGRMRAMVESTNGDLRSWYINHRDSLAEVVRGQLDPFVEFLPDGMQGGEYTIDRQLGSWIWITDQPSTRHGCYIKGTGTHTYWMSPEVNKVYGDVEHGFSQDVLDTKPIQCLTMPMAAAFCAWDNRKLQTFEENKTIFGSARFPWGDLPEPGGYRTISGVWTLAGPADLRFGTTAPACPTCLDNLTNWTNNYEYPPRNPNALYDYSYWISAPGRFPMDEGPYGHRDVAGTLIEMTGTKTTYIDRQGRSPTYKWGLQGSWEGHEVHYNDYAFYFMVKYGKTGFRCSSVN